MYEQAACHSANSSRLRPEVKTEMHLALKRSTRALFLVGILRRIWLRSVSCGLFTYIKPIPTHEKIFAVGKSGPKCHF